MEIVFDENKKIVICLVYKPPSTPSVEFLDLSDDYLCKLLSVKNERIIMGDFNFDLLCLNSYNFEFFNLMLSHGCFPMNRLPSRITEHSATLVDTVFLPSNLVPDSYCDIIIHPGSDHLPVTCMIKQRSPTYVKTRRKLIRYLRRANSHDFREQISVISWEKVYEEPGPSRGLDNFLGIITPVFESACPLKLTRKKERGIPRKPWIDDEVVEATNARNACFFKSLNDSSQESKNEYICQRSLVNKLRRSKKKKYYIEKFNEQKGDMRGTWQTINGVIKGIGKYDCHINVVTVEGVTVTDKQQIAHEFGKFFSGIGSRIKEDTSHGDPAKSDTLFEDNRGEHHNFQFEKASIEELTKIVKNLKSNAAGIDGLNLKVFKVVSEYLLPCLLYLVNLSLEIGEFPEALKQAKVLPLSKSDNNQDMTNWRPISLLPLFSKIYEKIVHRRLYEYLDKLRILSDSQFGFRTKHSTVHAAYHLLECVNSALERNFIPLTVFIDLRKTFDFNLLLSRLACLGGRKKCLDWFRSYLHGRSIKVVIDDVVGKSFNVNCGVPQGSVLGHLLFLKYVNTMRFYLPYAVVTSFADDTALIMIGKSVEGSYRDN